MGATPKAKANPGKPAAPNPPATLTLAEIDELIELKQRLAPELGRLKPAVERCEELTRKLRLVHEADPGNKTFTELGTSFDLFVGEKRNESIPDKKAIFKFFGVREFVELIADVTKAAVVRGLQRRGKPESGADAFFHKEQIGWREVSVVAKAPAPPAPPAKSKAA